MPVLDNGDPHWMTPERKASWRANQEREAELVRSWSTLPWERRCQYRWCDRYRDYDGTSRGVCHPDPVVVMSTPKFDGIEGVLEDAFLQSLRANRLGHRYLKSTRNGDDLVNEWKLKQLVASPPDRWGHQTFPKYDYERAKKEYAGLIGWTS